MSATVVKTVTIELRTFFRYQNFFDTVVLIIVFF